MIKLFYTPGTCARAAHIALQEAGAAFEAVRVDLRGGQQQTPEYLAINPKARVPALQTDEGVLTECLAILGYIAQAFPEARLAPTDPWGFAQAQAFNSYLASTVHIAFGVGFRPGRYADDEGSHADMRRKMPQNMLASLRLIESSLFKGPWVLGDDYSVCDPYLFTLFNWLAAIDQDPKQFPALFQHSERMAARPAVIRALAREAEA